MDDKGNPLFRHAFSRQPEKCLVFDGSSQFPPDVSTNICDVLEKFLLLSSHLNGIPRLSLLSIIAVLDQTEVLLPAQHVFGNYSKIQCSLAELRQLLLSRHCSQCARKDILKDTLLQACCQFKKYFKFANKQTVDHRFQVEIIFVTNNPSSKALKEIEQACTNINLDFIKRIQVVSVNSEANINDSSIFYSDSDSPQDHSPESHSLSNIVDTLAIDSDSASLSNFFLSWLQDTSSNTEHLQIAFSDNSSYSNSDDYCVIKCDVTERILSPHLLPFTASFTVQTAESCVSVTSNADRSSSRSTSVIPVYKIVIEAMMPTSALCDSLLYGMPMILSSTICWKMEWDDLERNQQRFQCLCNQLHAMDHVLIGYNKLPIKNQSSFPYHRQNYIKTGPKGYYVILPCNNGTMLLKSLAVSEMLLPTNQSVVPEHIPSDVQQEIQNIISNVQVYESYNPLRTESGLCSLLKDNYSRVIVTKPLPTVTKRDPSLSPHLSNTVQPYQYETKTGRNKRVKFEISS